MDEALLPLHTFVVLAQGVTSRCASDTRALMDWIDAVASTDAGASFICQHI